MNETKKLSRSKILGMAKTAAILLLGGAVGAGLIYSLQPPKVAENLAYDLFLFTSDKPVGDFTQQIAALKQSRAGTIMWAGGEMQGNVHFGAPSGALTRLNIAIPDYTTPFTTLPGMQFDIRGEQIRDRVRVSMDVGVGELQNGHELNLGQEEYRVVELQPGGKGRKKWLYGIIVVEPEKIAPAAVISLPRPAPMGGGRS